VMKWGGQKWELRGKNPYGAIPVHYVPHERTKDSLFGDSQIPRQQDIVDEINSRSADIADAVRAMRPGVYTSHDIDGTLNTRKVDMDGITVARVIDLGHKRVAPNSGEPGLDPLGVPDAPETLLSFPKTLLDFWMMMTRISPAVFGLDDTRSGRITGPAIAQRMWTSIAHSTTERINFTEAKTAVDRALILALSRKRDVLAEMGVAVPEIDEKTLPALGLVQKWPPMIPLERQDRHQELTARLRESGISIEAYLEAMGVEDIEEQKRLILEWQKDLAEIEIMVKEAGKPEEKPKQNVDANERTDS